MQVLQGAFMSILEENSLDGFRDKLVKFAAEVGFERVGALTVIDRPTLTPQFISIDNAPVAYTEMLQTLDRNQLDPVAQHCKRLSVPIIWDQGTYVRAAYPEQWERQAPFGYRTGVTMALHLPDGKHFALGVSRDTSLPSDASALTRLVADLQLFAVYAQEAAFRLLIPPKAANQGPSLTPRELESLKWTMEGKTAWEVGAILGISERSAVFHVNNAMHKLDCVNKHQAVLKAIRLGLIR